MRNDYANWDDAQLAQTRTMVGSTSLAEVFEVLRGVCPDVGAENVRLISCNSQFYQPKEVPKEDLEKVRECLCDGNDRCVLICLDR